MCDSDQKRLTIVALRITQIMHHIQYIPLQPRRQGRCIPEAFIVGDRSGKLFKKWFVLQNDQYGPSTSDQSGRNAEPSHFAILAKAEELAKRIWAAGWLVVHHNHLPKWLRDNDFLVKGHRPPMNSFWKCFKSVFRVHTETGNIWTHLLGKCILYVKFIKSGNIDLFQSENIREK